MSKELDLTGVHPTRWAEIRKRIEVIEAYLELDKPTHVQEAQHAEMLGIAPPQFRRLVSTWQSHRDPAKLPNARAAPNTGSGKGQVSHDVNTIIQNAITSAEPGANARKLWLQIAEACEAAGLKAPSRNAVWLRLNKAKVHLKPKVEGVFIDHCMLNLLVESTEHLPWLSLVATFSGRVIAFNVSIAAPTPQSSTKLIVHALGSMPLSAEKSALFMDIGPEPGWEILVKAMNVNRVTTKVRSRPRQFIGNYIGQVFGNKLGGLNLRLRYLPVNHKTSLRQNRIAPTPQTELANVVEAAIATEHKARSPLAPMPSIVSKDEMPKLLKALKRLAG